MMDTVQKVSDEIGRIRKSSTEVIVVSAPEWQGRRRVDARIWAEAEDGTLKPTRKGINLRPEDAAEVAALIARAAKVAARE